MERKGTEIGERRSKHWVAGLLLALSVSFSLSLSSLSLFTLSLSPAGRRLELRARRAPQVVVLLCAGAHHGLWCVVLLNLAPLAVKTFQHRALRDDSLLTGVAGCDPRPSQSFSETASAKY